jgi:hypothetical protein
MGMKIFGLSLAAINLVAFLKPSMLRHFLFQNETSTNCQFNRHMSEVQPS